VAVYLFHRDIGRVDCVVFTDVESTTRLERLPAPAPVQAQETLFMAVFKEQAAANREMMREQAAMSRENTRRHWWLRC